MPSHLDAPADSVTAGQTTLGDVFPWISLRHPDIGELPVRVSSASQFNRVSLMTAAIVNEHRATPLGQLFRRTDRDTWLGDVDIGNRMSYVLTRNQVFTLGELLEYDIDTLSAMKLVGPRAIELMVEALVADDLDMYPGTGSLPPEPYVPPATVFSEIISRSLDSREREILVRRTASTDPETLQQLGDSFGVSRERIRQIEQRIISTLNSAVHGHPRLAEAAEVLTGTSGIPSPTGAGEVQPELMETVDVIGLPVWQLLAAAGNGKPGNRRGRASRGSYLSG